MPNWKKIITSGSNAALNSLTVSNTITGSISGSLTGNATRVTISTVTGTADVPIVLVPSPVGAISSDNLLCVSSTPRLSFNPSTRLINATSSWAQSSSFVTGSIFTNTNPALSSSYTLSSSYALSSSYTLSASYALTATTANNATTADTANTANAVASPLTQNLTVEGDFIINDGTYNVFSTRDTSLYDSTNGSSSLNWDSRTLIDSNTSRSIDWGNRSIHYPDETTAIDYSNASSLIIKNNDNLGSVFITSSTMNIDASDSFRIRNLSNNSSATGSISSAGSTLTIGKNSTFENNISGDFTIKSPVTTISGSIILNSPGGIYGFTSASTINTGSVPGIASNTAIAFAQNGSNFFMYVYIGGRWRSSSLL